MVDALLGKSTKKRAGTPAKHNVPNPKKINTSLFLKLSFSFAIVCESEYKKTDFMYIIFLFCDPNVYSDL